MLLRRADNEEDSQDLGDGATEVGSGGLEGIDIQQ